MILSLPSISTDSLWSAGGSGACQEMGGGAEVTTQLHQAGWVGVRVHGVLHLIWCDGSGQLKYHSPAGWTQLYQYTADLLCLDSCRPVDVGTPPELTGIRTPLAVAEWASALQAHPDRAFAHYVVEGLTRGFWIGFDRKCNLTSVATNMHSANLHPEVISSYLHREISLGRMLGPFPHTFSAPELQVNRFGVIPKGHNTGKWRLITDLSFPRARA